MSDDLSHWSHDAPTMNQHYAVVGKKQDTEEDKGSTMMHAYVATTVDENAHLGTKQRNS